MRIAYNFFQFLSAISSVHNIQQTNISRYMDIMFLFWCVEAPLWYSILNEFENGICIYMACAPRISTTTALYSSILFCSVAQITKWASGNVRCDAHVKRIRSFNNCTRLLYRNIQQILDHFTWTSHTFPFLQAHTHTLLVAIIIFPYQDKNYLLEDSK